MMTDEDIRRGMPFFETEEEREAWRRDQGYSVSSSPETYDRIPLPEEVIDTPLPRLATFEELKAQQPPDFLKADVLPAFNYLNNVQDEQKAEATYYKGVTKLKTQNDVLAAKQFLKEAVSLGSKDATVKYKPTISGKTGKDYGQLCRI